MKFQGHKCDYCGNAEENVDDWFDVNRKRQKGVVTELCSPECGKKLFTELVKAHEAGIVVDELPDEATDAADTRGSRWTKADHDRRHYTDNSKTGSCPWCRDEGVPEGKAAGQRSANAPRRNIKANDEPCWWCGKKFPTVTGHYTHMNRTHGYRTGMTKADVHRQVTETAAELFPHNLDDDDQLDGLADDLAAEVAELRKLLGDPGAA